MVVCVMLYKVWAKDGLGSLWGYHNFRDTVNGTIYSYDIVDNVICSVIYVVSKPIPKELFDRYFFDYEIIKSN